MSSENWLKNFGQRIAIIAGVAIISNAFALLNTSINDGASFMDNGMFDSNSTVSLLFEHYAELCSFMVFMGVFFFIGGRNLAKSNSWSIPLLQVASATMVLAAWGIFFYLKTISSSESNADYFSAVHIIGVVIWSLPFLWVMWALRKFRN